MILYSFPLIPINHRTLMEVNEFLLQKEILLYVYFDCIITKKVFNAYSSTQLSSTQKELC